MRRWASVVLQNVSGLACSSAATSKRFSVSIVPLPDTTAPPPGGSLGRLDPYVVAAAESVPPTSQQQLPHRLIHRVSEIFGSAQATTSTHSTHRRGSGSGSWSPKASRGNSVHRNSSEAGGRGLVKRRSVIRIELEKEVQLVKSNIRTKKPWRDALYVMVIVLTNTIASVACASAVAMLFAAAPPLPSTAVFTATSEHRDGGLVARVTVAMCLTGVIVLGAVVTFSFLLSSTPNTRRSGQWGFLRSLCRLLWSSWLAVPLAFALAIGGVASFAWISQRASSRTLQRGQLFLVFSISYACIVRIAKNARRLYIQSAPRLRPNVVTNSMPSDVSTASHASTMESSMTMPSSPRSQCNSVTSASTVCVAVPVTTSQASIPHWRPRRYDLWLPFLSFHIAFVYLAVSSTLILCNKAEVMLYSSASIMIKVCLQEAARHLQLRRCRNLPFLLIHAAITAPTIAIDAQIRLAFTQMGVGQSAVATTVSIVVCEVLFRTAKILRLRHVISSRIARCTGMHRMLKRVHSKIAVRDVAAARAEYAQFLDWKSHVLRLHAAEVYADMHGEYISIGSSMAVLYFLGGHPSYRLSQLHGHVDPSNAIRGEQLGGAVAQVVLGLLVDYGLSVVEIIHEVPLYETIHEDDKRLRPFLTLLLPVLAAVNVAATATFFATPS